MEPDYKGKPPLHHPFSGHNITALNAVVQYVDVDTLRTLALVSQKMYSALEKCRFNHTVVVILEAPILDIQQRVIFNGVDVEETSHCQRKEFGPDYDIVVSNDISHDLIIPDYVRNIISRSFSVEIVIYRRRLGTILSRELNIYARKAARAPADGEFYNDDANIYCMSKTDPGFVNLKDTPGLLRFLSHPWNMDEEPFIYPYYTIPSLMFDTFLNRDTIDALVDPLSNDNLKNKDHQRHSKRKRKSRDIQYNNSVPYIEANYANTRFYYPRLENLPLPNHNAITKSLKININDYIGFDREDWLNSVPGCVILPSQTWFVNDASILQSSSINERSDRCVFCTYNYTRSSHVYNMCSCHHENENYDEEEEINCKLGQSFRSLESLVLQYSHIERMNQKGDCEHSQVEPNGVGVFDYRPHLLSHFFIPSDIVFVPNMTHFGVVGTLLDRHQYSMIVTINKNIKTLHISPGLEGTSSSFIHGTMTLEWISHFLPPIFNATEFKPNEDQHSSRKYDFYFDLGQQQKCELHCHHNDSYYHTDMIKYHALLQQREHILTCEILYKAFVEIGCIHASNYAQDGDILQITRFDSQNVLSTLTFACHYCTRHFNVVVTPPSCLQNTEI